MKTSTRLALIPFTTSALSQSVVEVTNGIMTTLTGAAASSWERSFSSDLSTNLASVTSSCFPFCDSSSTDGAAAISVPDGSSLASSISSEVSSAIVSASSGSPDASSLASSIRSQVSSAVESATSAGSSGTTASASGNGASTVGTLGMGMNGWTTILMSIGAGMIGVAAVAL